MVWCSAAWYIDGFNVEGLCSLSPELLVLKAQLSKSDRQSVGVQRKLPSA